VDTIVPGECKGGGKQNEESASFVQGRGQKLEGGGEAPLSKQKGREEGGGVPTERCWLVRGKKKKTTPRSSGWFFGVLGTYHSCEGVRDPGPGLRCVVKKEESSKKRERILAQKSLKVFAILV